MKIFKIFFAESKKILFLFFLWIETFFIFLFLFLIITFFELFSIVFNFRFSYFFVYHMLSLWYNFVIYFFSFFHFLIFSFTFPFLHFVIFSFFITFSFFIFFRHMFTGLRKRIDQSKNGNITLADFISMTKSFPVLVFPVSELQEILRKNSLGNFFFLKIKNLIQIFIWIFSI